MLVLTFELCNQSTNWLHLKLTSDRSVRETGGKRPAHIAARPLDPNLLTSKVQFLKLGIPSILFKYEDTGQRSQMNIRGSLILLSDIHLQACHPLPYKLYLLVVGRMLNNITVLTYYGFPPSPNAGRKGDAASIIG
jgi:hypothetical protein